MGFYLLTQSKTFDEDVLIVLSGKNKHILTKEIRYYLDAQFCNYQLSVTFQSDLV